MSPAPDRRPSVVLRFRRALSVVGQLMLVVLSNRLAFWLRFDGAAPAWALDAFRQALPWLVAIRALTFVPFRLYEGLWRYTSIYDLQGLFGGVALSTLLFYLFTLSPLGPTVYPRSIYVTDAMLLTMLLGGIRLTQRLAAELGVTSGGKRVLIFGAGDAAELIVRDMKSNRKAPCHLVGLVDDDPTKRGRRIHGVAVLGTRQDLAAILKRYRPDEVLIAIPRSDPATIRSIVRAFEPFKIPIKTLPNLHDIIDGKVEVGQIRNLSLDDLLTRAPVGLDRRPIHQLIEGRRVMVTGAGGSIGSELCRQIARLKPAALLMFERYENSLHQIRMELEDQKSSIGLVPIIGDVTDVARINEVMQQRRPEIIFHAAAHKHVPLMEENPCEAVKNNVRGTRLLAQAAEAHGVDRFIMISSDKAVNPTSMMGASKRLSELVIQEQANGSGTSFSIVRFGNVLGSNGSVVPRFIDQIRKGGPVTITHPEMRRFFMLIPEAVQLVLHAASQADSGAIYVLEMGEPVKLVDMARDLIRLSGLIPQEDIKIEYIGLRPGEKLFEELVGPDEDAGPSAVDKILCVRSRRRPPPNLFSRVEALEADAARGQSFAVRESMKDLVGLGLAPSQSEVVEPMVQPPTRVVETPSEQTCPKCLAARLARSRSHSMVERVHKHLTAQRLFRCEACGWRGWVLPTHVGGPAPEEHLQTRGPIDPSLLDQAFEPYGVACRPTFSPRNLS